MRLYLTISLILLFNCNASAQDSCLPVYNLPVKSIQLSLGKMAYVEKGKGKVILFIHGLGGNISHWLKVMDELSKDYKCIAVDLPGYGWSDKLTKTNGTTQLQLYADALCEFLKKKKINKLILAGHSMGGQVAIITALQLKNVRKLILVDPAGLETFTEKEAELLISSTPATAFEKQDETVIRNNFKINFFHQQADVEQLIQDRLNLKKCSDYNSYCETVSAGIIGMLSHPVKDSLSYLKMPVLIIYGANDMLIPNRYLHPALKLGELAKQSAALIPNCQLEMIENAGHMVMFEKHTETSVLIKNFVQ